MTEKLRRVRGKVKPTFKTDESESDEFTDGIVHTGSILVRKYIDNLDMEFYAGRASLSGKETTEVISTRLPADLIKDISIIVESGKSRFRDRSELVRTATYILVNYIANKLKNNIKDAPTLRDIEDFTRHEQQSKERLKKICDDFRNLFREFEKYGDSELDLWIKKNVQLALDYPKDYYKKRMLNTFWNVMKENEVDPEQYIKAEDLEGE